MAPVIPDPDKIKSFRSQAAFAAWMKTNHARETEVWLKVHKKGSGLPSVTTAEALDVALCWGWIDGIRKSLDEQSFLQRYTPRRARSLWSQVNRDHVARLTAAGQMTPHGQRQVDLAKADGRWAAAYAPSSESEVPADLAEAIAAVPAAQAMFDVLTKTNRYALVYRVGAVKRPETRQRKIEEYVAMLARGETIHPQKARPE